MANGRAWMPLYCERFVADTAHLTPAQCGAYLRLIMFYWVNGKLPKNEEAIRRITGLNNFQWTKDRTLLKSFFSHAWVHSRVERELAQAAEISKKRSASAKQMHMQMQSKSKNFAHRLHHTDTKKDIISGSTSERLAPSAELLAHEAKKRPVSQPNGGSLTSALLNSAFASPPNSEE